MSESEHPERRQLRMATCGACKSKQFLPGEEAPFTHFPCNHCGHPMIVPTSLRNFELREIIASGGMGTVYRAFDQSLERQVAVKMLKKEMAQDRQVMESFYREARATAALNHTNIIHIYSFDEHEGQPYLVMELADHGSLDGRIEREGCLPEEDVLRIGSAIANALESALKHNLLHRDIKPGNILFNEYGEPKLVDFGLARMAEGDTEYEAAIWGTPYYVAPEKVQRLGETFHSDMYSLGGTLYHALTGHVPFEAETVEEVVAGHIQTPLTPPNQVRPDISQDTSDAIGMAMAKDPAQRFADYEQMSSTLELCRQRVMVARHQAQQGQSEGSRGGWSLFRRGH